MLIKKNAKILADFSCFKNFTRFKVIGFKNLTYFTQFTQLNTFKTFPYKQFSTTKKIFTELDEEALREEILDLQEKMEFKKVNKKLNLLIDHYYNIKDNLGVENIEKIYQLLKLLVENLREMGKFEESISKQINLLNKIENLDSEEIVMIKVKLLNRIAFDYSMLEQHEESLRYVNKIIEMLENRVKEDRISLVEDKCSLAMNILNLVTVKASMNKPNAEINEDLKRCLKIYRELPNKLENISLSLLKQLGVINYYLENFEDSLKFLEESWKFKRSTGEEEDDEAFIIIKTMADDHLEMDNKAKAIELYEQAITIKEKLLTKNPEEVEDLKQQYIDIARIYEVLADEYLSEGKLEIAKNFVDKAMDHYLTNPLEPIFLAKCYFILAEIFIEQSEYNKCMEYAKKYIQAFEKFSKDYELNDPDFDLEYYTRLDLVSHQSLVFRAYKYIATCHLSLKDKINCRKFAQKAIDQLINLNKPLFEDEGGSELLDILNFKFEITKLYEMMDNYALALKDYDEILSRLKAFPGNKIYVDEEEDKFIDKRISIIDAIYCKANIFLKMEKFEMAKKLYNQILEKINKDNIEIEDERKEEISEKIHLVNLKLRTLNEAKNQ